MGFFDRFRRQAEPPTRRGPTGRTLDELKAFIDERDGVEGYVEPPTSVYAMSLCLVAADGEFIRRPVKNEQQARSLCAERGVPVYDARIVGYPRRMKDYQRGVRQPGISLDDLPPLDTTEESD